MFFTPHSDFLLTEEKKFAKNYGDGFLPLPIGERTEVRGCLLYCFPLILTFSDGSSSPHRGEGTTILLLELQPYPSGCERYFPSYKKNQNLS
jgi:hypothetical protein